MKAGAYEYEEDGEKGGANKKPNGLPIWGNEKSMNLNALILTNIQSSQYFKVNLYQLKTYHEVIDEIYYNVSHLEPWEKGSRKTSGQTGMCGGVRGVGAGGIVSTAFCILYKLYTLRLTRKQVTGLLNHSDSPYIRGLGFMYIRYTQPPADLWDWFEPYLDDEEEIDVRAGGGQTITIGQVVRHMLTKLDWYSTLFPRIPVPIQKDLEKKLGDRAASRPAITAVPAKTERYAARTEAEPVAKEVGKTYETENRDYSTREKGSAREKGDRDYEYERDRERERDYQRDKGKDRDHKEKERDGDRRREKSRERSRDYPREKNGDCDRNRDRHRERERDHHDRHRNRDKDRRRSRSRSHDRKHRHHHDRYAEDRGHRDFADLLEREKHRIKKEKRSDSSRDHHHRSRSRSRDRDRRHRY